MTRAFLVLALVGACSDDAGPSDASIPTVDIDNASCGTATRFTGEYVDWDNDAAFCGIFGAAFHVQGTATMASTAPNGRFDLCLADQPTTLIDITPSQDDSACTTPPSKYMVPGIAIANRAVIFAQGGLWSGRAFTVDRQASLGQPFDAAKAHVFVHVAGTPRPVALDAPHGPTQAVAATTWADGDTGHEVYFPNVDVGGGTANLSVMGGISVGTGAIPLAAGKVTTLTIVVN